MKTCALVAASDFNEGHFRVSRAAGLFDAVYAVDAGFAHLEGIACLPDVAIGDFDSLGYAPACAEVRQFESHKDKSDLELAFDLVQERGFERVVVYGALGGRLDHTVANLQMCARFAEDGMAVTLVGVDVVVHILTGPGSYELPRLQSGTVSVFSATPASRGLVERGMEYAVDGAVLTNRTTRGLSNELVGEKASVSLEDGTLYIFHPLA